MSDLKRDQLLVLLPQGRALAMSAAEIAGTLHLSTREVGALVAELIDDGHAVGSACTEPFGYFRCVTSEDVEQGSHHIRSRAMASLVRLAAFRKAAAPLLTPNQLAMFDVEAAS